LQELLLLVSDPASVERLHACTDSAEVLSHITTLLSQHVAEDTVL
jgi:mannitol/fructose-specific phosphotransferase system IIA component (Ntr-type)